ncbi:proline dehydrogenase family protein [uncultured Cyclobacterium sp.]|uniref:proline dehydrogenase family protein n=1 Tax=uncultured Cyclobacterium sp. TaxID=453820 RepID=UPI0030EB5499|tara:strand:- start:165935 stop:167125 length:1191 start_codon:yes stop_codon:yes gene_type:complete
MRIKPEFSFDNLKIAFAHLKITDLKRMQKLYRLMNYPFLVMTGVFLTKTFFQFGLSVKEPLKRTVFKQFCGGESFETCQKTINKLGSYGVSSILDYSVEGKEEENIFEATMMEILNTIQKTGKNPLLPFAVFKVSGIASTSIMAKVQTNGILFPEEEKQFDAARARFFLLCKAAANSGVKLMVDGEESWFQDITDSWMLEAMKLYNKKEAILYNTFQMYRTNMEERLKDAHKKAVTGGFYLGAKLVRGAYMEKERKNARRMGYTDPIHSTKEATDNAYNNALNFCVKNIQQISLVSGSHNELSNKKLAELIDLHGFERSDVRFYFSQLYGMGDHISFNLAKAGFNVAKYLPYGPVREVLPYLGRRIKENSGISGQISREQILVKKEIFRRKNLKIA